MAGYVSNLLFIYLSKLLGVWNSLIRPTGINCVLMIRQVYSSEQNQYGLLELPLCGRIHQPGSNWDMLHSRKIKASLRFDRSTEEAINLWLVKDSGTIVFSHWVRPVVKAAP